MYHLNFVHIFVCVSRTQFISNPVPLWPPIVMDSTYITSGSTYTKGSFFRPTSRVVRRMVVSLEGGLLALGGDDGIIEV